MDKQTKRDDSFSELPDRDALDARLALVNGFIDQNQLDEARQVESTNVAEALLQLGHLSAHRRSLIEPLVVEHLADHDNDPEQSLQTLLATVSLQSGDTDATQDFKRPPATSATPGEFAGYELLEQIGRGGMGVVHNARQVKLDRIVALKMIRAGELADEEEIERFKAEAEAAANLDHPGIVPVHEVGEANGQHFFSMGFVDGETLADQLRDGPLEPRKAADIVRQIAEAVEYAHSKQIIHRDLKPGNILMDDGKPRITDFGLAKRMATDTELTATGQVLGTPSYMPPEQASGGDTGPSADVYAIGAILYATLTGKPPHQSATPVDTLLAVLNDDPANPRSIDKQIPRDLETICLKCLNKDPRKRYSTAGELAQDLDRWLTSKPIYARRVGRVEKS